MEDKKRKKDYRSFDMVDALCGCFNISIFAAYLLDSTVTFWSALKFAAIFTVPALFLWTSGAVISTLSKEQRSKFGAIAYKVAGLAICAAVAWAIFN